jgi:hypothetical protein
MKKCKSCGTMIEDSGTVCEVCVLQVQGIVDPALPRIAIKPGLQDVTDLADKLALSMVVPIRVLRSAKASVKCMVDENQLPVFEQCVQAGILTEDERGRAINAAMVYATVWAVMCFAIGVEQALGNLSGEQAAMYLRLIARAYGVHAAFPLLEMARRESISQQECEERGGRLVVRVSMWSNNLREFGMRECGAVMRTNSAFLEAVKAMDTSEDV